MKECADRFGIEEVACESANVFESFRVYRGVIFKLEEHLDRLCASAKTAGVPLEKNRRELEKMLYNALWKKGASDAFLRLTVTRRGAVSALVTTRDYPSHVFEKGVVLAAAAVRKSSSNSFFPEAKTSSYGPQVLATHEMREGVFDVLFLGAEHFVREARTSNLFLIKKSYLITPPAAGILEGVTRRTILELAAVCGLAVREDFFTRHDLYNADEVFLSNTSGEMIPVREIDGRKIGTGAPGPCTKRLGREFKKVVETYIRSHGRRVPRG